MTSGEPQPMMVRRVFAGSEEGGMELESAEVYSWQCY